MEIQLPRPVSQIVFRCSEETETALSTKLPIVKGSMLSEELLQQAREIAKGHRQQLTILVRHSIGQEEFLKAEPDLRRTFLPPSFDDGVTVIVYDSAMPPRRIRVDGREHASRLIWQILPDEGERAPAPAVVKLAIVIGKDGSVAEIDPLAGPAGLISPAVDAVRQWKYQPTLLNGRPVEIETTVEVPFPPRLVV